MLKRTNRPPSDIAMKVAVREIEKAARRMVCNGLVGPNKSVRPKGGTRKNNVRKIQARAPAYQAARMPLLNQDLPLAHLFNALRPLMAMLSSTNTLMNLALRGESR